MKRIRMIRVLAVCLAALMTLNCSALAPAAGAKDGGVQVYRIVHDVREDGTWQQMYLTDADGNRVQWGEADVRAAADELFPMRYDLRENGAVTPVKNQGYARSCWAFGALAAAETNYILQGYGTAENTDFSEAQLVWFTMRSRTFEPTDLLYGDGYDAENPFDQGGDWAACATTMMRGSGPLSEARAPWIDASSKDGCMEMAQPEENRYSSDATLLTAESMWNITEQNIKRAVLKNGGVAISLRMSDFLKRYSFAHQSLYNNNEGSRADHLACVVGWDDTFSRKNFKRPYPEHDGAWLVKNSYGSDLSEDGYIWLSYEDKTIIEADSYIMAPAGVYDNRYQYDAVCPEEVIAASGSIKMANVFTAQKAELLTHTAFFSVNERPTPVKAEVYVSQPGAELPADDPFSAMERIDAATTYAEDVSLGYYTLELDEPVALQAGQKFAVVITVSGRSGAAVAVEGEAPYEPFSASFSANAGESFVCIDGLWQDTTAFCEDAQSEPVNMHNVLVKAMTRDLEDGTPSLRVVTPAARTQYAPGDTPDLSGLVLEYTAADGTKTTVRDGITPVSKTISDFGEAPLIVSYRGVRAAFPVQVTAPQLRLQIKRPSVTTLLYGDEVTLSAQIEGLPDGMQTAVRWTIWNDVTDEESTNIHPSDSEVYLVAGMPDCKRSIVSAVLVDRFERPIDTGGALVEDSVEFTLRCGLLYRLRYFVLSMLGIRRVIQ